MKKHWVALIRMGLVVLPLLLCACSTTQITTHYARFQPDERKIVYLSVDTVYNTVEEVYMNVYDFVRQDDALLKFNTLGKNERIKELKYNQDMEDLYIGLNRTSIEGTDSNIEYNNTKYKELKKKYGNNPKKSETAELGLLLKQSEMLLKTKEESQRSLEIHEMAYKEYSSLLENYRSMSDEFRAPVDGYILSLALQEDGEGKFSVGTLIRPEDIFLEVNSKNADAFTVGQTVSVKLPQGWTEMIVVENSEKVVLRFADGGFHEHINLLCPIQVELRPN